MSNKLGQWFGKTFNTKSDSDPLFYPVGMEVGASFGNATATKLLKDFSEVPEVNTVLNYLAWSQSLVELQAVNQSDNLPYEGNDPIIEILKKPNFFQSQKELWRQTQLFRSIFGDEYMYFLYPVGMPNSLKAMYTLPPQYMDIFYPQQSIPFFLNTEFPKGVKYQYNFKGATMDLPTENILHLNDNNVDQKPDNYLEGFSRLNPLQLNIQNIRAAYEARNVILTNRGAIGILSNKAKDGTGGSAPMHSGEKKKLQEEMAKYGLMKKQWRMILTSLNLGWTQITTDMDKLRVYEEVAEDFRMICNEFGPPYELFKGGKDGLAGDEKEQVQKQFFQNTVIPTSQERIQAVNDFLKTDEKPWKLVGTFDHLLVFQEDILERSQALNNLTSSLNTALTDGAIDLDVYQEELQKFNITTK